MHHEFQPVRCMRKSAVVEGGRKEALQERYLSLNEETSICLLFLATIMTEYTVQTPTATLSTAWG